MCSIHENRHETGVKPYGISITLCIMSAYLNNCMEVSGALTLLIGIFCNVCVHADMKVRECHLLY